MINNAVRKWIRNKHSIIEETVHLYVLLKRVNWNWSGNVDKRRENIYSAFHSCLSDPHIHLKHQFCSKLDLAPFGMELFIHFLSAFYMVSLINLSTTCRVSMLIRGTPGVGCLKNSQASQGPSITYVRTCTCWIHRLRIPGAIFLMLLNPLNLKLWLSLARAYAPDVLKSPFIIGWIIK